ncbi:hypothetical protein B0H11DRAFT_1737062 [Mycena galericulata]|nr:hypothetical protein B0H11DRAFT_1737062 [Mycena galericulata]
MYLLIYDPPRRHEKRNIPLIIYTVVIFVLGTVFVAMDLNGLKVAFIDNRNAPGGPTGYALSQYGKPLSVIPNACAVMSDWLAAGLLLYRCVIIFHLNFAIVALPILMYLGAIGNILVLFQSSRPDASLWTHTTVNFGVPYYALSTVLNVLITLMITTRLLMRRRELRNVLGSEQAMSVPYTSIAAMLVESSLLYTITSILFLVPYGLNSDVSNIFIPILIEVQLVAPLLIILRVAMRRGWDEGTLVTAATSLRFQDNVPQSSHYTEGLGRSDRAAETRDGHEVAVEFEAQMHESKGSLNLLTSSSATGVVYEV